jgi:hypothetical protein
MYSGSPDLARDKRKKKSALEEAMEEESIFKLVPPDPPRPRDRLSYKSIYNPLCPPTGSTFVLKNVSNVTVPLAQCYFKAYFGWIESRLQTAEATTTMTR